MTKRLLSQVPVIVACVTGSLAVVWAMSRAAHFEFNPSLVAGLSAVAAAVAIVFEDRSV